jgi:hypothetical protein
MSIRVSDVQGEKISKISRHIVIKSGKRTLENHTDDCRRGCSRSLSMIIHAACKRKANSATIVGLDKQSNTLRAVHIPHFIHREVMNVGMKRGINKDDKF